LSTVYFDITFSNGITIWDVGDYDTSGVILMYEPIYGAVISIEPSQHH
jgi:hypothetical protein